MPLDAQKQTVCIIGAGLTGLVSACSLLSSGYDVILLESALKPGGMVSSFQMGSGRIEYIYHHVFTHDDYLISLLSALGLQDQLKWYRPNEALYAKRRLFPFSTPLDLLRFPLIPLTQRLRTGLSVLKAGRLSDFAPLEGETAAQWLRRNGGPDAYEQIWHPLLRSKFDSDADQVSAVWIWNKFKLRGHSREKDAGSEKLGYLDGSFGRLIDALVSFVEEKGGRLLTGHTVMNICEAEESEKFYVSCILENCRTVLIESDAVVATVSARQFASLSTGLNWPDVFLKKLNQLRYKGDFCLILRLKNSLSPYYWTTICDDLPFVLVVEHTNLVEPQTYGGHVVYLSRYLDLADPMWTQPDGDIFRQFVSGLKELYPHFHPSDIIDWRLRRTPYAQPVIGCHYKDQMPPLNTPIPRVKLAGVAQIYPEDRGMNYAVRLGLQAAEAIDRELAPAIQKANPQPSDWTLNAFLKGAQR